MPALRIKEEKEEGKGRTMKRKYGTQICCVCTSTPGTGNRATSRQTGWLGVVPAEPCARKSFDINPTK